MNTPKRITLTLTALRKPWTRTVLLMVAASLALLLASCGRRGESVEALKAKAEKGDAKAQYSLGVIYENGRSVAKDEAEAVKWLRKAADQGDGPAQANLGVRYADGQGVKGSVRQSTI